MKKWLLIIFLVMALGYFFIMYSFEVKKNSLLIDEKQIVEESLSLLEIQNSLGTQTENFVRKLHQGEHIDLLTTKAYEAAITEGAAMDNTNTAYDELQSELDFHLCSNVADTNEKFTSSCIYSFTSFHNQTLLIANTLLQIDVLWVYEDNELKVDEYTYKTLEINPIQIEEGEET